MTASDIYKALTEIAYSFPKPNRMVVAPVSLPGPISVFNNASARDLVWTTKNSWNLKDKPPTKTFTPTNEAVISYVKSIAEEAAKSPISVLVVIDSGATSVWVTPETGCFIATAAYGSPFAREVTVLREFRDEVLVLSISGRLLVSAYYWISPPIASAIERRKLVRSLIRRLLHPIVQVIRKLLNHKS